MDMHLTTMHSNPNKKRFRISKLRHFTPALILTLLLIGTAGELGWGTLCSLDIAGARFTCPLGYLQLSLADHHFSPAAWLSVGLLVAIILLAGRFFCAWVCPTGMLKTIFKDRRNASRTSKVSSKSSTKPLSRSLLTQSTEPSSSFNSMPVLSQAGNPPADPPAGMPDSMPVSGSRESSPAKSRHDTDSSLTPLASYAVLGGSLLSSFLFGFPVFCAICPVGLFFASLFAIRRLFFYQSPSLELVLFPAILIVEVFVLRKWCQALCPLGAFLRILASLNKRFLRPQIDRQECLLASGVNCQACSKVCSERVDLKTTSNSALDGCTTCLECWDRCPINAIKLFGVPSVSR
jgi:polyferredoxin